MRRHVAALVLAGAGSASFSAAAQVYRCVNTDGVAVFSDRPCTAARAASRPVPGTRAPNAEAAASRAMVEAWERELAAELKRRAEAPQPTPQAAPPPLSQSTKLPFDQCRALVSRSLLAVAGKARTTLVVNSASVVIARICVNDGTVLLTCSAADGKFITTTSSDRAGC